MAERVSEVLVGGVVLAVAAGFLFYAGQVSGLIGGTSGGDRSPYTASFRSVEGVSVGTDVRMAGVKVGTVTALDLNPQTFRAETSLVIDKDIRLPEDTAIVIASEGLLGGTFIELVPGGMLEEIEPGGEILDTQSAISLITLLTKFVAGGPEEDGQ